MCDNQRKPHVHADVIKAWADGAEVEYKNRSNGLWYTTVDPCWAEVSEYRVKPEPKPLTDLEKYGVEVGDLWEGRCPIDGLFHSIVKTVGVSCIETFSSGAKIELECLTCLLFRRGVVNKL